MHAASQRQHAATKPDLFHSPSTASTSPTRPPAAASVAVSPWVMTSDDAARERGMQAQSDDLKARNKALLVKNAQLEEQL